MFSFVYSADRKTWHYGEEPLPFTCYNFGNLVITDEELLGELSKVQKEIRVSNVIVEAALEQICEICKIKLRRVKHLKGIDEFWMTMKQYR